MNYSDESSDGSKKKKRIIKITLSVISKNQQKINRKTEINDKRRHKLKDKNKPRLSKHHHSNLRLNVGTMLELS